jgi:hypothetical protein
MNNKNLIVLIILCLTMFMSYSQNNNVAENKEVEVPVNKKETKKIEPHRYGGWYCPDNLGGFPAVDINNWKNVPVVNGRMATKEETQNGISLIFVDAEKYSDAKPLDITMPKLATFYNVYSKREELIIVIQAINIANDSIVGFRYLNGGNGSSRLNEIKFLSDNEIDMIPASRFISKTIKIKATQNVIWEILTKPKYAETFLLTFDKENKLETNWRKTSNVNYHYSNSGNLTSAYAHKLFGNFYIQNDYDNKHYNEKFLLLENEQTKETELKIVCGPFGNDYESQQVILNNWAKKVKKISELNQTFSIMSCSEIGSH